MSTLSWHLSTSPTQTPEYWLLLVDGLPCTALARQAPYTGPGDYSVDMTQLDFGSPLPTDGAVHNYCVALVGDGVIGPPSTSVAITLPNQSDAPQLQAMQQQSPVEWPVADTLVLG